MLKPYRPQEQRPPSTQRREVQNAMPDPDFRGVAPGAVRIDGGEIRERQPGDVELAVLWGSHNPVAPPPASAQRWDPPISPRPPFKNLKGRE